MRTETELRNRRLLEALDYIDGKYIDEALGALTFPPRSGEYKPDRRSLYKAYAVFALRAACLLLVAGLISMLPQIIRNIHTSIPSGMYSEYILTQEDLNQINSILIRNGYDKYADTLEEVKEKEEFCGKYGSCFIFTYHSEIQITYDVIVGNYKFISSSPGYHVIHESGVYELLAAYEFGHLTDTDIQKLSELFSHSSSYIAETDYIIPKSAPVELSFEEISDIVHSYFRRELTFIDHFNNDNVYNVRCFGKFDDAYAVMISYIGDQNTFEFDSHQVVYGYDFDQTNMGFMFVYENGTLHTLSDAVNNGILNKSQVGSLYDYYNEIKDQYPIEYFNSYYKS